MIGNIVVALDYDRGVGFILPAGRNDFLTSTVAGRVYDSKRNAMVFPNEFISILQLFNCGVDLDPTPAAIDVLQTLEMEFNRWIH